MAKNLSRKVTIYINGKEVESSLSQIRGQIIKLEREQSKLPIGSQEYINKTRELARLNRIIHDQKVAVNDLSDQWQTVGEKLANVSNVIMGLQSIFQMADATLGSVKDLAADAAALDDTYADVMKTTGLTRDQVLELNDAFKKMDTRTSREQLNQLAYEAGKLGINSKEAVEQFVSASDKINIALGDVLGEGAMVTIGKMAEVYAKSTQQLSDASGDLEKQMLAIGSAVNQLGQSSTANEAYMVEFLSRMGGIATQAGLSADAILGFASALDQDMMKQEMSATAFQKFIMQMIKMPEKFAKSAQMSVSEFSQLMEKDMNEALLRVLEGFKGSGGLVALQPIFEDLGLDAARAASVISSMANSIDKVREAQSIANQELTTADSVIREFNTKNNNMAAQADKAKKSFQDMRVELGEKLYPVVIHFTKASTAALKGLSGYLTLWKENKAAAISLTTGIASLVAWLARHRLATLASNVAQTAQNQLYKLSQASTLRKAAATAKATASAEAERLASIKLQIQQEKEIIARYKDSAAAVEQKLTSQAKNRVYNLEIALAKQQTVATEASTAATKAQSAAFKATPWGMIIALATTFAFTLAKVVQNSRRFRKESQETAKQIAQESAQANILFDRLKDLNESSVEYKDTLSKLNDLYPDIISKYKDEKGHLNDIAAARQEIIDKIRQQVVEQRRLDTVGNVEGEYQSQYEKYASRVVRRAGRIYGDSGNSAAQSLLANVISANPSNPQEWGALFNRSGVRYDDYIKQQLASILSARRKADAELKRYEPIYASLMGGRAGSAALSDSDFNSASSTSTTTTSSSPATPTTPEKEIKKWKSVVEQVNGLITSFSVKSKDGLDKLFSEINAQVASARKDIEEAVGASRTQKDNLLLQLDDAANNLRRAKVDEYLKKIADQADKLSQAANDNPKLQEVFRATEQLAEQIKAYDDQIFILQNDLQQTDLATAEREKIEQLIAAYQQLKQQMTASAYAGIDTSVSTSGFSLTGDVGKDAQNYANLTSQISRAREATQKLRDLATDQATREEYEAQLTDLQEQQDVLDKIYAGATKFATDLTNAKALDRFIERFEYFGNYALEIFSSINDILNNIGQRELNEAEDLKNQNIEKLDEQLEKGTISQEKYEERKLKIEQDYDAKQKEIELQQWRREKLLNSSQAVMAGALAILRVWSDAGNGTTAMRAIQSAIVGAATLAQIAAIASEPAPYAKGGYVNHKTYMVGEAGSEWVASHRLLSDPVTAPVIEALENYQRGRIPLRPINQPAVASAAQSIAANRANAVDLALLKEFRTLAAYLSDPMNRRAVISRQSQLQFDSQENFLRSAAKLN